jgi:phosphopantothenoylcysteine decarboxylase/phosphopantothenate--cysteine ligase
MKLALWLKNSGISARELAVRVETTEATISRLKNGHALPSLELAGRIAIATGGAVTANDFLESGPSQRARNGPAGARILLIISGGIAAYKSLDLIRRLKERDCELRVILTRGGLEFVTPLSVGALAGAAPFTDLFDARTEFDVGHIRLARECACVVVAPATADLMAKIAGGHAGDLASAVLLATDAPILLAPAMNPHMWANPATQRNLAQLTEDGISFIGPAEGEMAEANEAGIGRMAEVPEILGAIENLIGQTHTGYTGGEALKGKHVIVTSGPTHEPIDPVRYIANRSSGKQGHAIASAAARAGARVTLVTGPVEIADPLGVETLHVASATDMLKAVEDALPADIAIFAAAVADWRMARTADQKLKKKPGEQEMTLDLVQNPDILKLVARGHKRPELVVGFAAETQDVVENAKAKRRAKGCDWIIANDVAHARGVMGGERNAVHLVMEDKTEDWLEMTKQQVAEKLISKVAEHLAQAKAGAE